MRSTEGLTRRALNTPLASRTPVRPLERHVAGTARVVTVNADPARATRVAAQDSVHLLAASLHHHMPAGAYRDFLSWMLQPQHGYQERWLQLSGLQQVAHLCAVLMADLLTEREWQRLSHYIATMNIYQMYEVVSDNLAIGLGRELSADASCQTRRELVCRFNRHAVTAMTEAAVSPETLLANLQPLAAHISSVGQSLVPEKQQRLVEAFCQQQQHCTYEDVDRGVWAVLVANLVTCCDVLEQMAPSPMAAIVRQGFVERYRALNPFLEGAALSLEDLVTLGTETMLVIPSVGYYLAAFALIADLNPALAPLVADGTIEQALREAALLTRLLNDIGPGLLLLGVKERHALIEQLAFDARNFPIATPLTDFLEHAMPRYGHLMTRLEKDIRHGETNIGVYGLDQMNNLPAAVATFGLRLATFAALYEQHTAALDALLVNITNRLADERLSLLIGRFVHFHEQLYAHNYQLAVGEYAI